MSDVEDSKKSDPESQTKGGNQGLSHIVVPTERCGTFNVHVQVSKSFFLCQKNNKVMEKTAF